MFIHLSQNQVRSLRRKGPIIRLARKDKKDNIIMMNKSTTPKSMPCKLCDQEHKSLVYCEKFQEAKVKRRFGRCIKSQSCYRCLRLDSAFDFDNREKWFKDHKPYCDDKWLCNVGKCQDKDDMWRNHILVCSNHMDENMEREADFKASLDQNLIKPDVHFYFATYHAAGDDDDDSKNVDSIAVNGQDVDSDDEIFVEPEVKDSPVYLLQYIEGKGGEKLLTFFDSGCYSAGLSDRAYAALDTVTTREGPTTLQVAGGAKILLPHGDEQFRLELYKEKGPKSFAMLRGLRMSEISCKFPIWPLTEAYNELISEYTKLNTGIIPPKVEEEIGGQTVDLMIGIKYAKYYPKLLLTLPSGLSLYQSKLKGYGGFQGVLGGPHNVWKNVMSSSNLMGPGCYLSSEFRAYKCHTDSLWSNIGIKHEEENQIITQHSLHFFCSDCSNPLADEDIEVAKAVYLAGPSKLAKEYQIIDQIGSELGYRCYKCRNCNDCRNGEHIEAVSLIEEREQHQIEQSLEYDHENKKVLALLPFIDDPDKALAENSYIAEKILSSQLKIANKSEDSKNEILRSFEKLESKGHIVPLSSLSEEEQVLARKPGYTIPWRVHWKPSSTTTPVRPVFGGSSKTKTGSSLNDILTKGSNQMAKMLHLLIVIYFIKTLIYGIRVSGNEIIHGFKVVANEAEQNEGLKGIRVNASIGMVLINIAITDKMNLRYDYTDYEVDPCKYPWNKYLRIIATCYRVADRMRRKSEGFVMMAGSLLVDVYDGYLKKAKKYLFKKTTLEVQHFKKKLKKPNKWMKTTVNVREGDIVIFKRDPDNPVGTCIWRIGRIRTAEKSRDDKVRTVEIEYRNYKEREMRTTRRAVRTIAVIHKEQDMDFVGELAAVNAEMNLLLQIGP
jgi:hypothetical protein